MIIKIISGGQTGIDIEALRIARDLEYPVGGYVTSNYMTEFGRNEEEFLEYNMIPIRVQKNLRLEYSIRNRLNVKTSDLCIVFNLTNSPGVKLSYRFINEYNVNCITIPNLNVDVTHIVQVIKNYYDNHVKQDEFIINFVGSRRTKLTNYQYETSRNIIYEILYKLKTT